MADGDPSTTWVASSARPRILLTLPHRTTLSRIRLDLDPGAAASLPQRLVVSDAGRHRVVDVDANGSARLPHWRVKRLAMQVESTYPAFTPDGQQFTELGSGHQRAQDQRATADPQRVHDAHGPVRPGSEARHRWQRLRHVAVGQLARASSEEPPRRSGCASRAEGRRGWRWTARHGSSEAPTDALRVDSVTLTRPGAEPGRAVRRPCTATAPGSPLVRRPRPDLPVGAVDAAEHQPGLAGDPGRQGAPCATRRRLAAGLGAPGRFARRPCDVRFTPARLFTGLLVARRPARRRLSRGRHPLRLRRDDPREPPATASCRVGRGDLVLVALAAGFLTGWVGLGIVAVTWVAARRFRVVAGGPTSRGSPCSSPRRD